MRESRNLSAKYERDRGQGRSLSFDHDSFVIEYPLSFPFCTCYASQPISLFKTVQGEPVNKISSGNEGYREPVYLFSQNQAANQSSPFVVDNGFLTTITF